MLADVRKWGHSPKKNDRRYPHIGGAKNLSRNVLRRREIAVLNQQARAHRTTEGQLLFLDLQLGAGVGAVKERARLVRQITVNA